MTEPTDAELQALWAACDHPLPQSYARAVLAKWGTPAVAGEPVAWRYRPSAVWEDYVLTDDPEKAARARGNGLHVEALCLATPQPTQAQAGAVPLTVDEVEQLIAQWSYELHGDRARYLVRMTEQHHGIKGGQHGL